jgi:threonine dehydratase
MISYHLLDEARKRISPHIQLTPLTYDPGLYAYLKWENHQKTGSFKLRGALNKIFSLSENELTHGLVAASAGNHGQGVATGGRLVGAEVMIFASDHAVPDKIAAMERLGAQVKLVTGGYAEAEAQAIDYANSTDKIWISPYNDPLVIAGQATIALETMEAYPETLDCTWVVPVGGGGLISGIALALREQSLAARIIGVQSTASPYFNEIFHHGTQKFVVELPSLADGLAGAVEEGAITISIINDLVDDIILVSEDEIAYAIAYSWKSYHEIIEGSAAVVLAALITGKIPSPTVCIFTGGNINKELHKSLIERHQWK